DDEDDYTPSISD
nr:Chain D, Helicase SEN1 [Saccharomyces cerevisiae]6O3X_E Chain E, Helicase SEN1 [Saccharomyces cerevisiae]6O3X_F Chain F, Helicase SEN1 [Saccharomyces cerevisiae]